jgi:hypothetical protein
MKRPVEDKSPVAMAVARYVDQRETDGVNRLSAFLWFSFATAALLILACLRAS